MFDDQLKWQERYNILLYCALGTYQLSHNVSRLWTKSEKRIEYHITKREFWIVPWEWTMQFPIAEGKHHDYRYLTPRPINPDLRHLPNSILSIEIPKGVLHFTEGVDPGIFT